MTQIKGCYLHYRDVLHNKMPGGIEKKVAAQIKAFNDAGLACDFILCEQPETTVSKVLSCLPFFSDGIKWPDPSKMAEYSYVYIRRPRFASKELLQFLRNTKKENPHVQIIYEIPTYPYDGEMRTPIFYPAFIKDRMNRKHLRKYLNRIAVLVDEEEVFGIETIKITNGIDLSHIVPKAPVPNLDEVHIISVARFERWHGIDRLVSGMLDYYQKGSSQRRIVLHVVGTGGVLKPLVKWIKNAGLESSVLFHGYCNSAELDSLYDQCSLAVESLGFHRRAGLTVSASLKSREYLAKGIPFISANEIDLFPDKPVDFFLQIPSDETSVDIDKLLEFHDSLYASESQESLIKRMRAFAEAHIGMNQAMQKVTNYILENN
ncbi:MAG: glycosyltransferase [Eggerthellaceae bacterium]|nr:glycosyltransferase [Eggerthellaceae bacterium]